jgi:hypothetical protein
MWHRRAGERHAVCGACPQPLELQRCLATGTLDPVGLVANDEIPILLLGPRREGFAPRGVVIDDRHERPVKRLGESHLLLRQLRLVCDRSGFVEGDYDHLDPDVARKLRLPNLDHAKWAEHDDVWKLLTLRPALIQSQQ